ncbi:MAG: hypothetical protein GTN49_08035 [candidate division Zixibacteria bacterium]|nr:hypothetical protein [candidate division Zixibacteria bacterium]
MGRVNITLAAALCAAAINAWAGSIPNATDEGALRLGPMAVAAFGPSATFGGGGAFWTQYDGSWFAVDIRFGGHVLKPENGTTTSVRWENEYWMYPFKGKFRPYLAPAAGLVYYAYDYEEPWWGGRERRERFLPLVAGYFGVRLNSPSSPFYLTFDGGYKYVDDDGFGTIRNRYFFGLMETVALRAGFEAAFRFDEAEFGYGLVDVGPCFSF